MAVQHQKSTDTQLCGHGNPHALKSERANQKRSQSDPHDPDASEVHQTWDKGIAGSAQSTGSHNGDSIQWLCQESDPQNPCGKLTDIGIGCKYPEHIRTQKHHEKSGQAHKNSTHNGTDDPIPPGKSIFLCPNASAD